ncbi:MAG: 50S ribosomal protein L30 [Oligoflexia bacterium]|nr:50S ribosomal protein L30 [Bdellovibrionales bacterium]MYE07169.1 50S ribosomal protein L30 [Oligoflexia bacterium]
MSQAKVMLKKSLIGSTKQQKAAAHCLGLRKPGQIIVLGLNPVTEGQINKIKHLISVEREK